MERPQVSVVIPARNEEEAIGPLLDSIRAVAGAGAWEIIVVDDGSTDRTAAIAERHGARVIRHPENQGNGASVRRGGCAAGGDVLVFLDADGQHPPEAIPRLLAHVGPYDMVVGARTAESDVSLVRTMGNCAMNRLARFLCQYPIVDLTSGFRAIKRDCFLEFAHLFPQRYSYPTTITMAMILEGYFVKYEPVPEIGRRTSGRSCISPLRDGMRFIEIMLRMITLFNPMRVFGRMAAVLLAYGLSAGSYEVIALNRLDKSSLMCIILGVVTFSHGLLADQISRTRREIHALRGMRAWGRAPESLRPRQRTEPGEAAGE